MTHSSLNKSIFLSLFKYKSISQSKPNTPKEHSQVDPKTGEKRVRYHVPDWKHLDDGKPKWNAEKNRWENASTGEPLFQDNEQDATPSRPPSRNELSLSSFCCDVSFLKLFSFLCVT